MITTITAVKRLAVTFHLGATAVLGAVFTVCGAPLSFGHDSIDGGPVNRGIFDNYPLTHLLDLDHDSWWIAEIKKTEISGLIVHTWRFSLCSASSFTCNQGRRDWPRP